MQYLSGTLREPNAAKNLLRAIQQELGVPVVYCEPLSLSISCHIGPGALAIGCAKKLHLPG